jgi:hypothetical protein
MIDVIQWLTGPAATQACLEDGVAIGDSVYCREYYARNDNDLVRAMRVADDAVVTAFDATGTQVSLTAGTLTRLEEMGRVSDSRSSVDTYFRLTTRAGKVTGLQQVFVP